MATAATYQDRKAITADTGACVERDCEDPAASGSLMCVGHRDRARDTRRTSTARLRKRRRRKGQCIDCGATLRKSGSDPERVWCTRHRIARNRFKAESRKLAGVSRGVDKSERVASRTITHEDGRTRYHGQPRRGQQTHADLDKKDLGSARHEIARGETGLQLFAAEAARAKAGDATAMPRIQRDGIKSDALGYLERAQRWLGDVLERHGHTMQRHGRRDGDEES